MTYHSPTALDDALDILERGGVTPIAGGTDWFPARGDHPGDSALLDVTRIEGFRGIAPVDGGWRIGAATRWSDILQADLPPGFDGLKAAAREVGSVQIQNAGTVAGNLCNASPAADGVPPLMTLNASIELVSKAGRRVLSLSEFVTGVRQTARRQDELLSAVLIPGLPDGARGGFLKLGARRYLVISITMVAVLLRTEAGRVAEARVAIGAASPVARRLSGLERALTGWTPEQPLPALTAVDRAALTPIDDVRASAEYRAEVAAELVARALRETMAREAGY